MGKKTPSAPIPPDPVRVAAAQSGINKDTAIAQHQLNMTDEFTPYGSSVFTPEGKKTPEGMQRYKRTTTLDPSQQRILDQQNLVHEELNRVAGGQVARVGETLATPFSYAGMPEGGSADDAATTERRLRSLTYNPYDLQAGKSRAPSAQGIGTAADAGTAAAITAANAYSSPFDYSTAPMAPGADAAARQQVIDSVYGQFQSRLDPRFESEQLAMETKLANSGIPRGSAAFSAAMQNFNQSKNDAYQSAQNAAIQAGGQEQTRLFGLGTQARQNAINEMNYLRQLPASEQGQLMGMYGQEQGLRQGEFGAMGSVRDREIQEQLSQRQTPMQEYQNLASMQQGLFGMQGQDRQRAIEEAAYLRNLPLNETSALMSGTQIMNPTFGAAPQTAVAGTDYAGLTQSNYANQLDAYNSQMQNRASNLGAITGMAGALIGGPVGGMAGSAIGNLFSGGGSGTRP